MESRHVVRVLDFGSISEPPACAGLPFMVLEMLRGEDLFSVASREGGLSPERVVNYMLQACAGLAVAHSLGIVHRDLKPENLFLAVEPDGGECLKVLDFGIARSHFRPRPLTRGQVGVGSPGYMSPEQVEGSQEIDARSDIWTLGVVMYELLSHCRAFSGETPQSLCLQILSAPIEPLGNLRPDLPPALIYVVERCMKRDREQRFQNVAELAEALAPLQEASPPSDAQRVRRMLEADVVPAAEVQLAPARQLSTSDVTIVQAPKPAPRRRLRRVLSAVLVAAILIPVVSLLPRVAAAPELAPARAWSENALRSTELAWNHAVGRARELWMKEPGRDPAPSERH
jgi:serine/threonine-protein kinase